MIRIKNTLQGLNMEERKISTLRNELVAGENSPMIEDFDSKSFSEQIRANINKIKNIQASFADSELTMEDITAEVEAVRSARYETGRQISS